MTFIPIVPKTVIKVRKVKGLGKKTGSYWYQFVTDACVMGDSCITKRHWVYGKKSTDPREIYIYEEYLCGNHY